MNNENYTVINGVLNVNHAWGERGWGRKGITFEAAQPRAAALADSKEVRRIVLYIGMMAMHGAKNCDGEWSWLRHQDFVAFLRETPTALADSCLPD